MQQHVQPIPQKRQNFPALTFCGVLVVSSLSIMLAGCEPASSLSTQSLPYDKEELTLHCPDGALADAITPMIKSWEAHTGAKVAILREPMSTDDACDIGIIPANKLGEWGEMGLLVPVPQSMRASDHPFQWFGLLPAYSDRLLEWGGQTLAIPLTGDGYVVIYRVDRFAEPAIRDAYHARFGRELAAPAAWDDFVDIAVFFAEQDNKPSLPPLPAESEAFFDLFCRIAASADRRALNEVEMARLVRQDRELLAFQHSIVAGKPRLQAYGFQQAARWLNQLQKANAISPGPNADPVEELVEKRAVMAVLALDQLARLPREQGVVAARFGIAPLPGSRTYFDVEKREPAASANPNYVPYFTGGRIGVVRTRCPHPNAAFDLLADLGSPRRSAELIATPGLGAGPVRVSHLDHDRMILWLGYDFDTERSKQLQDALRRYVDQAIKNPAYTLRGPDQDAIINAVAPQLRKSASEVQPADALKQADEAWNALDAKSPRDVILRWRQRAMGQE